MSAEILSRIVENFIAPEKALMSSATAIRKTDLDGSNARCASANKIDARALIQIGGDDRERAC